MVGIVELAARALRLVALAREHARTRRRQSLGTSSDAEIVPEWCVECGCTRVYPDREDREDGAPNCIPRPERPG